MREKIHIFTVLFIMLCITNSLSAQDEVTIPTLRVDDQIVSGTSVLIDEIVTTNFGFIVIRADNEGEPGGVIGLALIHDGISKNVRVEVEMINITPTLYATIHFDSEPYGQFQADVEGADLPVTLDDEIVMSAFDVAVISVHDQFLDPENFNRIVVDTASSAEDAWLVAHADDNGEIGEVLGHTFLEAGTSQYLPVLLSGDVTDTIYIMLHDDSVDPERYEFGETEGVDMPQLINEAIAMTPISTAPTLRVNDQIVIGSDLTRNQNEFVPFVVDSVLSDGAGWLVVHVDDGEGQAGEVIGFAPVQDGFNDNVIIELPQVDITPRLFPMLHTDSGESLVYEFGDVDDADLPATHNDEIIMGSAMVIPSIRDDVSLDENILSISGVTIDTAGWLTIHTDNGAGEMGDIIGYSPLNPGLNNNVQVEIDVEQLTDTIFLVLHYDTRPVGVFGFIQDDGSDLPVVFDGEPIVVASTLGE